jgi:hypothetical protein
MRNRSRSPAKQGQMPQPLDYTSVPDTEEGFPSSFRKPESKSFPCLRSYLCRRRLSFAAVLGMFVGVGVIVSVVKMRGHGRSGESLLPEFLRLSAGIQGVIQFNKVHRMRDAITCAFHE